MTMPTGRPRLTAVLGPTNTGKTYLAVERMLGHPSGMIGFPLRLLARENYDRIVAIKGPKAVALVTGEEKILPPSASYFVCTVESMPLDRRVSFVAIDEVQMMADAERGHIFTDRLLHARGLEETMFLGADTARPIIRELVGGMEFIARPRFSTLSYTGHRKVTRLPPRSAVVAFSIGEVYRLAELVRRQRGGTAVVLGALSPRARNAQVGMYQAGEVDYLVATDAIGMGLNMDVRHVAFSSVRKFDGRTPRQLSAAEIGQIAGRAGRHMRDGTFGATAELAEIPEEIVSAVEEHRFDSIKMAFWRNADLDLRSPQRLLASLERRPPHARLLRARDAEDQLSLDALSRDPDIAAIATTRDRVALLWEVCQIPDFRKTLTDAHTRLLSEIYRFLTSTRGTLPSDWVGQQIARLDRTEGDIDALMARIAGIRTWTYVSNRVGWLDDPEQWQERSRAIEDKLSDALHERLTQRFVDRRTAVLVRRLREGRELLGAVTPDGSVLVEGEFVGRLEGFRFVADRVDVGEDARPLMNAAQKVLRSEIGDRVTRLAAAPDDAFSLDDDGRILWGGAAVARLVPGRSALAPRAEALTADLLENAHRERIRKRTEAWLEHHLRRRLPSLIALADLNGPSPLNPAARGLAYRLCEALGVLPRHDIARELAALTPEDRAALSQAGVRFGAETLFVPAVLRPPASRLRALLWRIAAERRDDPALPKSAADLPVGFPAGDLPPSYLAALGYRAVNGIAVRVTALERLTAAARNLGRQGAFAITPDLTRTVELAPDELGEVLRGIGYRRTVEESGTVFAARKSGERRRAARARALREERQDAERAAVSPFAQLKDLALGR